MDKKELAKNFAVFGAGAFAVLGVIGALSLVDTFRTPQGSVMSPEAETPANSIDSSSNSSENADQVPGGSKAAQGSSPSTNTSVGISASGAEEPVMEPQSRATSPGPKTAIANLENNTLVTLTGQVTRVSQEDEFILSDPTGSVQIYTGKNHFTVFEGEIVTITGLVDRSIIIEVYANEIQHQDGTVTRIQHYD